MGGGAFHASQFTCCYLTAGVQLLLGGEDFRPRTPTIPCCFPNWAQVNVKHTFCSSSKKNLHSVRLKCRERVVFNPPDTFVAILRSLVQPPTTASQSMQNSNMLYVVVCSMHAWQTPHGHVSGAGWNAQKELSGRLHDTWRSQARSKYVALVLAFEAHPCRSTRQVVDSERLRDPRI